MSKQLYFNQFSIAYIRSLNMKTVLFQVIHFSMSTQVSSIRHIDRTLSSAITGGQSGRESGGNEEVHHIPQSSSLTETLPSDCILISRAAGGVLFSAEKQSVYSTAPADRASFEMLSRKCINK